MSILVLVTLIVGRLSASDPQRERIVAEICETSIARYKVAVNELQQSREEIRQQIKSAKLYLNSVPNDDAHWLKLEVEDAEYALAHEGTGEEGIDKTFKCVTDLNALYLENGADLIYFFKERIDRSKYGLENSIKDDKNFRKQRVNQFLYPQ